VGIVLFAGEIAATSAQKGTPPVFPTGSFIKTALFGHCQAATAGAAGTASAAIFFTGRDRRYRRQRHQRCKDKYVFHNSSI